METKERSYNEQLQEILVEVFENYRKKARRSIRKNAIINGLQKWESVPKKQINKVLDFMLDIAKKEDYTNDKVAYSFVRHVDLAINKHIRKMPDVPQRAVMAVYVDFMNYFTAYKYGGNYGKKATQLIK